MIIGVDLGSHTVNTSEKVSFYSKMGEDAFTEENLVVYEDKKHFVGEGAFVADWDKSMRDSYFPLLFTALARSSKPTDSLFKVIVGLPMEQYKPKKDSLKDQIMSNSSARIYANGHHRDICITDIDVAPEGASAYYNLDKDTMDRIKNKTLKIIDIGGRTTDVCVIEDNKIMPEYKSIPTGILDVYDDIVKEVNRKFTLNKKIEYGEKILNHGLFLDGIQQPTDEIIKTALQKCFNIIYKELELNFEVRNGYNLFTGGGSIILKKPLENRLQINAIFSKNPFFDNAEAFKKVGEKIWLKK